VCAASPLVVLACKGNHDIQFIANKSGGAEYCSKYATKAETTDNRVILNTASKKLSMKVLSLPEGGSLNLRMTLRAVANTITTSNQIGSVHACYVLCHANSLVQSSRANVYVNALQRKEFDSVPAQFNPDILDNLEADDNALVCSVKTQFGKRAAYEAFFKYHFEKFNECDVDYHSFLTFYNLREETKARSTGAHIKEGLSKKLEIDPSNGYIRNPISFILNNVSVCTCDCAVCVLWCVWRICCVWMLCFIALA
jgi:hypothetical protein